MCTRAVPVQIQFMVQFQCLAEVFMLTIQRRCFSCTCAVFVPLILPVETDRQTSNNRLYYYHVQISAGNTLHDNDNLNLANDDPSCSLTKPYQLNHNYIAMLNVYDQKLVNNKYEHSMLVNQHYYTVIQQILSLSYYLHIRTHLRMY